MIVYIQIIDKQNILTEDHCSNQIINKYHIFEKQEITRYYVEFLVLAIYRDI